MVAGVVALAVHLPSLRTGFVYDDLETVVGNETLRHPQNWAALLLHMRFRPIVNISYALDYAVFGLAPWGYHLTNVGLHAAVTVLGTRLAAVMSARAQRSASGFALATGLLFAAHPLLTQAVGYVSARSELLAGLFLLLGLLAAWRALEPGPSARWWVLTLGCFALAAGSKEPGAMLPFLALVMAWAWPGDEGRRWARARLPLGLLVGFATVAGLARLLALARWEQVPQTFTQNLALQLLVLWRYLRLFVLPWGQSLVQPFSEVNASTAPLSVVAGLGLLAMLAGVLALRRRAPEVTFGVFFFFLSMAPSTLVPLAEPMSEHRAYVGSFGLCVATVALGRQALSSLAPRPAARALWVAGGGVLLALGALSVARHRVWANPRALWAESAARAPGVWAAQFGYAQALEEEGDCAAAVAPFTAAVRLMPAEVQAHQGLARCLATLGRWRDAFEVLSEAQAARPDFPKTWANLGALALAARAPRAAARYVERATQLEPSDQERRARLVSLQQWLAANPDAVDAPWPPGDAAP